MGTRFFRSGVEPAIPDPFPHWEWPGAIDPALYSKLSATFPISHFESVLGEDNQVHRLRSTRLLTDPEVDPVWRETISYLTSQQFWTEIMELFGPTIRMRYPHLEETIGKPLEQWRASRLDEEPGDIVLEAQPVINTAVRTRPSRVRSSHLDHPDKLWAGLLYMRSVEDDTPGGALLLHAAKTLRFDGNQIPLSKAELRRSIPYEANRFAGFINAADAIHSVGLRPVTSHVRRYLNLYAKLPVGQVFDVPQMSLLGRAANRIAGMAGARRR
jgi:hypothetical protein